MERRAAVPAALAVGATLVYFAALSHRERQLSQAYQTTNVIVAKTDLPARTVLKPDLVETVVMPRKYMDSDAFEVRSTQDLRLIENLVTQIRIPKGNQVTQSALLSLSSQAGMAVRVPPGMRGGTLPVESDTARLIKPSDRVDVLVTFQAELRDGRKEKVTATLLQNILVIGVGGDLGQGRTAAEEKDRHAQEAASAAFSERVPLSLALNPAELQYLALATRQGEVSVGVRAPGDVAIHPIEMSALSKLFGGE